MTTDPTSEAERVALMRAVKEVRSCLGDTSAQTDHLLGPVERIVAARVAAARAEALQEAADEIGRTISTKGTAAAVLAPGKSYAVDLLLDRAHILLAGGHAQGGDSLPPSGRERLGVPPASAVVSREPGEGDKP